jgi:hypothetical protein
MGAAAIVTFGVGAVLLRSHDCGSASNLPNALMLGGIVLGLVVAIIGGVSFVDTRRTAALLYVLLGIVPIVLMGAVVFAIFTGHWVHSCSSD